MRSRTSSSGVVIGSPRRGSGRRRRGRGRPRAARDASYGTRRGPAGSGPGRRRPRGSRQLGRGAADRLSSEPRRRSPAPRPAALRVGVLRGLEDLGDRPCSTTLPAYITTTRSACSATSARSWVISTTAMSSSHRRSRSSCMICACTVTSSAVVGSSARSTRAQGDRDRDQEALAHAPGELVGVASTRVRARGCRPASSGRWRRRAPPCGTCPCGCGTARRAGCPPCRRG